MCDHACGESLCMYNIAIQIPQYIHPNNTLPHTAVYIAAEDSRHLSRHMSVLYKRYDIRRYYYKCVRGVRQ